MRTPNLNALRMFDAAARHLNFRLAAEELHLTQGAVAQQVRRLETELGLKLFDRKARGLELTDTGRSYHAPIRRALDIIDTATGKLRPQSTTLKISVTPSFAAKWLVPRLAGFEQSHPDIDVQTVASEGLADFRTDAVDLAIRQGHPPFGDDVNAELLAPMCLCAVSSPELAGKVRPINHIADLAGHRLIQDSHNLWDRLLEEAGTSASSTKIRFNQTALAMEAAMNSQGIALVPCLLALSDIANGRLVELWRTASTENEGYYLVSPAQRTPKHATQKMIDWCKAEVACSE